MDPQKIRIASMFLVWTTNQWHIYLKGENKKKEIWERYNKSSSNTLGLKHLK